MSPLDKLAAMGVRLVAGRLLEVLSGGPHEVDGYALGELSGIGRGTLYVRLNWLEGRGLVESRASYGEAKRYYKLTPAGQDFVGGAP